MTKVKIVRKMSSEKTAFEALQGVLAGDLSPEEAVEAVVALRREQERREAEERKPKTRTPRQSTARVKFSVAWLKGLEPRPKEYTLRDSEQVGLAVRVMPSGRRVFIVEARVKNGTMRRVTIGPFGRVTLEEARNRAKQIMGDLAAGVDPVVAKAEQARAGVTLQQALDDYLNERKLKESTRADVLASFRQFTAWLELPILKITPAMCEDRHRELTARAMTKSNGGKGTKANLHFRYLRGVLNHASQKHANAEGVPLLPINPVERLGVNKQWNRTSRRRSLIRPEQVATWWGAVTEGLAGLKFADEMRDCLILSMLTGVRPGEALGLRWDGVDTEARTLTFRDTKNHSDHELPLPEWLGELLKSRRALLRESPYVFADVEGDRPRDMRAALERVEAITGVHVIATDLRRTFITAAESLDVGPYALKRLLNHTIDSNDVTAGYIVPTTDRLRPVMQRIEDTLLRHAGVMGGKVIELREGAR